ncbi:MAG: hypothetical protein JNM62_10375 [Flavobacteriales bacterium]|nr:hypothetical protein [Flavobacteriales bacterium]
MAEQRRTRVAILCSSTHLPKWQGSALRHLVDMPDVELVAAGMLRGGQDGTGSPGLFGRLERHALRLLCEQAHLREDISEHVENAAVVDLGIRSDMGQGLEQLQAHRPDVVFSFIPLRPELTRSSELPIWQFIIGGQPLLDTGMPILGPHLFNDQRSATYLIGPGGNTCSGFDLPRAVRKGVPLIDPLLFASAWLPTLVLKGASAKRTNTSILDSLSSDDQNSKIEYIKLIIRLELQRSLHKARTESEEGSWNIGVLYQPITALLDAEPSLNVRWLPSPSAGNHRMEPFGYTASDGQLNVLYRKQSKERTYDTLARLRPKSDSVLKRSRSMLSTQANLEYPFVLERPDGAYAVISYPHQGRTELFKVAETNDGLDHVKILLNKAINSPTLTEHEGLWWLFGTDPEAPNNVLLAFHSERFDGPYTPHASNPIKMGSVGVRPAGTFFRRGNELWRPSQDASNPDNMAVILNRVEELTPTTFHETCGSRVAGFRGSVYGHGVRTLSAMGDITLIDGIRSANVPTAGTEKREHRKKRSSTASE